MKIFNPILKGCEKCQSGYVTVIASGEIKCTQCGGTPETCADCGNNHAANCQECHFEHGCFKCRGNWDFKDGGFLKSGKIFGECSVCKEGWKIGTSGDCDECAEGFTLVDGSCLENENASCGGTQIVGCRVCGTTDSTKCGRCATGYGLSESGESSSCIKCDGEGCARCDLADGGNKCQSCVDGAVKVGDEKCLKLFSSFSNRLAVVALVTGFLGIAWF